MMIITIPKRPGHQQREATKESKKQDLQDYFHSLNIVDIECDVLGNRLLNTDENCKLKSNIRINQTKTKLSYE
ncbi:hypothetical protein [Arcicella rosea]|uniref:Uncharacterized protein n=1 Tax=Arcicella rosea TaxID=502909 RepID=A0A841ENV1_9BACT|nr:hypothetical protein [Arcicella rosea]MBB6003894.1 hypothetical protein [Arcicella rosea]